MDLHAELAGVVDVLARGGIEYALCGGLALAVHGVARATKDIDVLVRPEDVPNVLAAVAAIGFTLDAGELPFGSRGSHPRVVRRVSKVEGGEVLTLDLVLLPPWLEDVWRTRERVEWGARAISVVSRQGLAEMKRVAGRPQDLADIERLERGDDEGA